MLSIIDAFKIRHSVRNYKAISASEKEKLFQTVHGIVDEVNQLPTPFGTNATVGVHDSGLGTMHFISGESGWLMLQIPKDAENSPEYKNYCIDAAFRAQNAVMRLTQNRISTVWVGGTFSEAKAEHDTPGFKIPAVVAFGYDANQKRLFDKVMGLFHTGSDRKDFSENYFDAVQNKPFKQDTLGKYELFLTSLRSSPSALNGQPSKVLVNENTFTLFDGKQNNYTPFDMGIILGSAYFYAQGKITYNTKETDKAFPSGGKYIASFTVDPSVFE